MSILAKQELLQDVTEELKDKVPQQFMETVLSAIADSLGKYEIESDESDDDVNEKEDCLYAYLDAKRIEGKSPKTVLRYEYVIRKFYETCNRGPRRVTVFHIRNYLSLCQRAGNSDRTVEGYRSVLHGYFSWLMRENMIESNPTVNISPISFEKKERLPYSEVELYKIHECCDIERGPRCTTERNNAIVSMLESTGCRVSEICRADRSDVDLVKGECLVHGKGNKERIVYLNETAVMLVRRYLESRTDSYPALFIGKNSERLTPGGVRLLLKNLEKKAGITNVHPHRFRRTLATHLIDHGMPIQEVSRLLGHENINTTMTYIYVSNVSVKNSYKKYN